MLKQEEQEEQKAAAAEEEDDDDDFGEFNEVTVAAPQPQPSSLPTVSLFVILSTQIRSSSFPSFRKH